MAKKEEEIVDDLESSASPKETPAEAPPSTAEHKDKKAKFTRTPGADGNTYSTSYLQAKQSKGEDDAVVYETEDACKARLGDMFDIDGTECVWDPDAVGFVAMSNKRYKALIAAAQGEAVVEDAKLSKSSSKKKTSSKKATDKEEPSMDSDSKEAPAVDLTSTDDKSEDKPDKV